jgi:hypothetical protein
MNAKTTTLLLVASVLAALPATAGAEATSSRLQLALPATMPEPGLDLATQYERGRTLRSVGLPMAAAGAALVAVGIYFGFRDGLHPCGILDNECSATQRADVDSDRQVALYTLLGGVATMGVGIPLWAVGFHRMRDAERMGFQAISLTPVLRPTPGGVVAGVQLVTF